MYEPLNTPNFGTLLERMPGAEGAVVPASVMLPWLIELFNAWNEGEAESVTASRAEIALQVSERCQVPLPGDIPAGAPPLPHQVSHEVRGVWLLQLAIGVLAARFHAGRFLADDCRRFLTHAHAWVQGV